MRTRPDRGLGPFTGGQLTAIVITALLALGLPAGALAAATSTNVVIGNPGARGIAKVVGGRLQVAAKVSGTVSVKGTVSTAPPTSALYRSYRSAATGGSCPVIATAPSGKNLVVVNVSLDVTSVRPDLTTGLFVTTKPCSTPVASVHPTEKGLQTVHLEPGIVVKPGAKLYLLEVGEIDANVTVTGYLQSGSS